MTVTTFRPMRPASADARSWWPEILAGGLSGSLLASLLQALPLLQSPVLAAAHLTWLAPVVCHDVRTRRAPNRLVFPALAFFAASSFAAGSEAAARSLLGGVAAFLVFLLAAVAGRGAMGFGDVKVACLCGMAVGLADVPALLVLTSLAGAGVAALLLVLRLRTRSDSIAFTPFLAGATCVVVAYSRAWPPF